ncbi:ser/thr protein phosphatase family protein [Entamoeba histolytica HM-1:IMSS-B]|uniref:Ser/thr protein phosphatase family protein n=4 Tax=Entamoeba histolytica TaxID=5759 RepID=C4LTK9_ENTH1|nr:ser/thr protein phosphatase family protein [Entamoeba histolytica HM-1:IMSS]EAL50808.2 ser/thr protein phosphatase family protein [Entamoeba histolytica HM-1:IMSS]EMH76341.1 ser/thr protein phosphatase family protein [Entamoeba histolytica HM-1:IMSS-B]ENY61612.1 ser/thr protein phosphatase family protein, putative [Entamoeba histolytica HM-1:IMSS-A]GAT91902.1 Ser Thr protein phosphatase family protein [Entamoeba histolytica]|eukprot:XP_656192.2 ser/thr protein phosphatase family protein [Entamoeba histolytica HM-1:IMSS]
MKRFESIFMIIDVILFIIVWITLFGIILYLFYPTLPPEIYPTPTIVKQSNTFFTIVQVSDPHFSKWWISHAVKRMNKFCSSTLKKTKPELVVVTGDITKGQKFAATNYPMQHREEWEGYRTRVDNVCKRYFCNSNNFNQSENELLNRIPKCLSDHWIDIRGNHDSDGMIYGVEEKNYAKDYLISGDQKLIVRDITKDNQTIRVILIDMFQETSLPVDGEGIVNISLYNILKQKLTERKTTHTILAGHYPINSVVVEENDTLLNCLRNDFNDNLPFSMYWSGHYHQKNLHVYHKGGIREVECPTMENNVVHIYVFKDGFIYDKDLYIYKDTVLLLKPTAQKYYNHNSAFETLESYSKFEGIVFSLKKVKIVKLYINGEEYCQMDQNDKDIRLYQCDAQEYLLTHQKIYKAKLIVLFEDDSIQEDEQEMKETFNHRKYILTLSFFILTNTVLLFIEIRLVVCCIIAGLLFRFKPLIYLTRFVPFTFIRKYRKMPLSYLLLFIGILLYIHCGYIVIGDIGMGEPVYITFKTVLVGPRSAHFHSTRIAIICFLIILTWYCCYGVALYNMQYQIQANLCFGVVAFLLGVFTRMVLFTAAVSLIFTSPFTYIMLLNIGILVHSKYGYSVDLKLKKSTLSQKVLVIY